MHVCGLVLVVPVLACVVAMSLMPIGFLPLLLPFAGVAISVLLLPFGFGNPYLARLVRRRVGLGAEGPERFIVQATFTPRVRGGFRAVFEDADDLGVLSFSSTALHFDGDSVQVLLPLRQIDNVITRNVGMRGLFLYGQRVVVSFQGSAEFSSVEFAERASVFLPGSRRVTRQIWQALGQKLQKV